MYEGVEAIAAGGPGEGPVQLQPLPAPLQAQKSNGRLHVTRAAIGALYETHYGRVVRYVALRVRDNRVAEDLASEVFVRALHGAGTYEDTGAPMSAWIFRIAHNIVVDHLRRNGRRPLSVPLDDAAALTPDASPVEVVEREEELVLLVSALQRLSERQRQVLSLRFGAGMTAKQVGRVMGKSPGAVRQMQFGALRKLRRLMNGHGTPVRV